MVGVKVVKNTTKAYVPTVLDTPSLRKREKKGKGLKTPGGMPSEKPEITGPRRTSKVEKKGGTRPPGLGEKKRDVSPEEKIPFSRRKEKLPLRLWGGGNRLSRGKYVPLLKKGKKKNWPLPNQGKKGKRREEMITAPRKGSGDLRQSRAQKGGGRRQ